MSWPRCRNMEHERRCGSAFFVSRCACTYSQWYILRRRKRKAYRIAKSIFEGEKSVALMIMIATDTQVGCPPCAPFLNLKKRLPLYIYVPRTTSYSTIYGNGPRFGAKRGPTQGQLVMVFLFDCLSHLLDLLPPCARIFAQFPICSHPSPLASLQETEWLVHEDSCCKSWLNEFQVSPV